VADFAFFTRPLPVLLHFGSRSPFKSPPASKPSPLTVLAGTGASVNNMHSRLGGEHRVQAMQEELAEPQPRLFLGETSENFGRLQLPA